MGFFGFLKKPEPLAAPQKPAAATTGFPPASSLPAAPEGDIPPPPQPDEFSFESLPAETRLIHDDVHHDSDLDALLTQEAPRPDGAAQGTFGETQGMPGLEPAPEAPAIMPDLPELHAAFAAPEQEEAIPAPQPAAAVATMATGQPDADLPDFSDDDIAAAERLSDAQLPKLAPQAPRARESPLPPLMPLPVLPPSVPDELYVDAHQYQAALKTIAAFKSSVRKGDAALAGLGSAMSSHKQQFAAFAEQVNAVQEDLIRIDNIMISQR